MNLAYRTKTQLEADEFDRKLYALIYRASAMRDGDATGSGIWGAIALRLAADVRPLIRGLMHHDDVMAAKELQHRRPALGEREAAYEEAANVFDEMLEERLKRYKRSADQHTEGWIDALNHVIGILRLKGNELKKSTSMQKPS